MTHVETPQPELLETAASQHGTIKNAPSESAARAASGARRPGWLALLALAIVGCDQRTRPEAPVEVVTPSAKPAAKTSVPVLDVSLSFPSIESVGATKRIHWEKTPPVDAHSAPDAWKITFDESGDFAGICWKNKPGNTGESPGDDLSKAGYRRIAFWARGGAGGESVEFRAGGLGGVKTRYKDTFDLSAGRLRLTSAWKEYGIYVTNADLSSVMTPFCVLLHREDNPGRAVIYVDAIEYRG